MRPSNIPARRIVAFVEPEITLGELVCTDTSPFGTRGLAGLRSEQTKEEKYIYIYIYIYIHTYIYIYIYMYTLGDPAADLLHVGPRRHRRRGALGHGPPGGGYDSTSIRENGKGGMRKGGIGQVNRNTQQTNTNKLDFPIPPFLIPPFPISQSIHSITRMSSMHAIDLMDILNSLYSMHSNSSITNSITINSIGVRRLRLRPLRGRPLRRPRSNILVIV